MITKKYYKLIHVSYEDMNYLTLTNISEENANFSVSKQGFPIGNLEYSLDGENWTTYDLTNTPNVVVNSEKSIYLRGNNQSGFNHGSSVYFSLKMSKEYKISGNLFSLRNSDPATFSTYTTVLNYEFYNLFGGDIYLKSAKELVTSKITNIGDYGFRSAFSGCSRLIDTPDFSSVTSVGTEGFREAFYQCYFLKEVKSPNVAEWVTTNFQYWLYQAGVNVSGTKTFFAPTGLSIPADNTSGIPTGWTRVDY